ncbi:MAG: PAS domain-containing protein [Deltaproteobacteria bacterium]|nr:PAS domain-containing protein [Deltaproteobacteria bacterium]
MTVKKAEKALANIINELRTFIELSLNENEQSWDEWILATTKRVETRCWERKKCGHIHCPAYKHKCGRCWLIAGTMCGGEIHGTFAKKYRSCLECEVFQEAVFRNPVTELQEHILILIHSLRTKHQELQLAKEQTEAERSKTETVIASIGAGLTIQGRDFRILYQNAICQKMAGSHLGEECFKAYEGRDRVCDGCPLVQAFDDGLIHTVERFVSTDSFHGWVEVTASPLKNAGGEIVSVLEIVRDVSERKRIETELVEERDKLREALAEIKTLRGFIPICASCKKIRDDKGYWNQIEAYISDHTHAQFSHGICPDCAAKLYPGLFGGKEK